jgi:predicted DsbA family dithiol-disulfide isomerase
VAKRQVEVFTAGCPVCEPAVRLVQEMACPDCEITVHDLRQTEGSAFTDSPGATAAMKAAEYGIKTVPAVVVDGRLVLCCQNSGPNREELAAAGIGHRL